eukprot:3780157-Rhodomonas_salina.1
MRRPVQIRPRKHLPGFPPSSTTTTSSTSTIRANLSLKKGFSYWHLMHSMGWRVARSIECTNTSSSGTLIPVVASPLYQKGFRRKKRGPPVSIVGTLIQILVLKLVPKRPPKSVGKTVLPYS